MPFTDAELVLQPISPEEPTGDNLEYDPAFAALERAIQGKPEQQIGSAVVPGEEPNWSEVEELSLAFLARSKDLRGACYLTRALIRRRGFEGLNDGLFVLRSSLERFWEGVHPRLDPDDNLDPTIRANAISSLTEPAVLNVLRASPLVRSRSFGPISLRDIAGAGEGEGGKHDAAAIDGAFLDADLAAVEAMFAAIRASRQHIQAIDQAFDDKGGGGPDMARLIDLLRQAEQTVGSQVKKRKDAEQGEAVEGGDGSVSAEGASAPRGGGSRPLGELGSRDDVVRALDKIDAYYSRYEPSSPVPLLLQRCKKLVTMSFMDIVRELAPDGVSQVETVVGKRES